MKRILFAGLAAAVVGLAAAPASAQWGPPGGGSGYGSRDGYGDRYDQRRPRQRDFDDDEDERPRYRSGPAPRQGSGYGYDQPPSRGPASRVQPSMGSICVTPRGNCAVGNLAPSGSP